MTSNLIRKEKKDSMFKRFLKDENGVTAAEYGLLAALISVVIIVALTNLGEGLKGIFEKVTEELTGVVD